MGYVVGIDLGTTFTAAAVWRDGSAQISSLGSRGAAIPSVVLLREDETELTGEAADRRAMTEPERVAREFKRRLGDTTPILVGGSPYSSEALMARLLRAVVAEVATREGGPPDAIAVCHPANWGPYKIDLLRQAIRIANLPDQVTLLSEPEAAAIFYATQQRLDPGQIVAVYDLGGGTFDAAVLRRTETGFEILGKPEGIERLGGIDFDAAVFAHVRRSLGDAMDDLDESDSATQNAVARLRADSIEAKEALSSDTDASVPVLLPNIQTEVRITRAEFEAMIRPSLVDSIEALRRALRSASVDPENVDAVLLVGGSSRIPLVAQLVSAEIGRPVAVDAHPKHAIALGAAHAAALASGATTLPTSGSGDSGAAEPTPVGATPSPTAPVPAVQPPAEPTQPVPAVQPPAEPTQPVPAVQPPAEPTQPVPAVQPPAEPTQPVPAVQPPAEPTQPVPAVQPPAEPTQPVPAVQPPAEPTQPVPVTATSPPPGGGDDAALPTTPGPAPLGDRPDRTKFIVMGLILVAVLAAVVVWALQGGDNGSDTATDGATDAEEPATEPAEEPAEEPVEETTTTTTSTTTSTTVATTTTLPAPCAGVSGDQKCAEITDIQLMGDSGLLIEWTSFGFTPSVGDFHGHFYWDTSDVELVGTQAGDLRQPWDAIDAQPYDSSDGARRMNLANKPEGVTQACVTPADGSHAVVDPAFFHCVDLPT